MYTPSLVRFSMQGAMLQEGILGWIFLNDVSTSGVGYHYGGDESTVREEKQRYYY